MLSKMNGKCLKHISVFAMTIKNASVHMLILSLTMCNQSLHPFVADCWLLTLSIQWFLANYLSKNSLHATCWMPCSYWYMFGMTALNISWSPITVTSFSLFSTYISKNLNMMWHNLKMFLRIVFRMQLIIFIMLTLFNLFLVFRPDNRTRVSE